METYTDQAGMEIKVGDILVYNEGTGFGQSIDEVVEFNGELAAIMRVGCPEWTALAGQVPLPLKYYKLFPEHSENVTRYARVVDVEKRVAFTPEYAASIFDV